MGAPTIYRWDDANAPVANGLRGSFINILKACLVNGYGSKAAAGWTIEFEQANKLVLRNNPITGTGMYLRLDSLTTSGTNQTYINAFETMSNIDTGLGQFFSSMTGTFVSLSTATTSAARAWTLIADDRCFYFFVFRYTDSPGPDEYNGHSLFFGDFISLHDPDPYACILYAPAHTNYSSYLAHIQAPTSSSAYDFSNAVARNSSGALDSHGYALIEGGGPCGGVMGQYGAQFGQGQVLITRPYINDGVAYSIRGYMPGLYYPCHAYPYSNFDTPIIDGKQFIALNFYSYSLRAQALFRTDAGFRP